MGDLKFCCSGVREHSCLLECCHSFGAAYCLLVWSASVFYSSPPKMFGIALLRNVAKYLPFSIQEDWRLLLGTHQMQTPSWPDRPTSWKSNLSLKRSLYSPRPGQAVRVPVGWGSQIATQLAHEGGKFVKPTHWLPFLPRKYSWYSFLLEAESTPRAVVRSEGLCQ